MFDSIFKKPAKPEDANDPRPHAEKPADDPVAHAGAKQEAMAKADSLADESAAVEFILSCDFSDARLKASQHIHSKPALMQVVQAMRNTDRRVAKLMQQRLDALHVREADRQRADECVRQAQRLAEEAQLTPNQVADLDRAWQIIGNKPDDLSASFDAARVILRERLEAQAALQRGLIDLCKRQQQLLKSADDTPPPAPEQFAQSLDELENALRTCLAAPEAKVLPRHLLAESEQQQQRLRQTLASQQQRHAAIRAHEEALAGWEAADALNRDELRSAWAALPPLHDADARPLQARFNALLGRAAPPHEEKPETSQSSQQAQQAHKAARQQFGDTIAAMEKALQEGSLHLAAEHDKALRAIDSGSPRLSGSLTGRLAKARSELKRLQGWARWSGNMSREELQKAAEELPGQSLPIPELAKKVGSLRERWKALDASAGPASKEAWTRFDAACTAAYAPVAEHSRKLAEERRHNLAAAETIIVEAERFAASSQCGVAEPSEVDWKSVAGQCTRLNQMWKRLGPIDRKAKKAADARFFAIMRQMTEPLAAQQKIEMARREKLIEQAATVDPSDRHAPDKLRRLSERWQEHARALPLEHHDEHALWKKFRAACDAVFTSRKVAAKSADAERQKHLQERQALCAELESAATGPQEAIRKLLRDTRDAWNRTGPVPRAAEPQIEARYQAAVAALQKRLDDAERTAAAARMDTLRAKLAACRRIEERLAEGAAAGEGAETELARLQSDWQALPALPSQFEHAFQSRFENALSAWRSADHAYVETLERNRPAAMQLLLRLEILSGMDSPPAFSRERLKLQVEVLNSSLKTGQKAQTPQSQASLLTQLCGLPALLDSENVGRLERLISRMKPVV